MARTTRRKYYKRKIARWAPNIAKVRDSITANASGVFSANSTLAFNPAQSSASVSQTYTAKNFDITFTLESPQGGYSFIEGVTIYIMYVPQGMTVGNDYYQLHPEYILNYKYIGSPSGSQYSQPIRVRTRMARKLQTGDQIILYVNGSNTDTNNHILNIDGVVRWWTKAN